MIIWQKPLKLDKLRQKLEHWLPEIVRSVEIDTQIDAPVKPIKQSTSLGPVDQDHLNELEESVGSAFIKMVEAYLEDFAIVDHLARGTRLTKKMQNKFSISHIASKAVVKNFGANELAAIAKELEEMGRNKQIEEASTQLLVLFDEADRVIDFSKSCCRC